LDLEAHPQVLVAALFIRGQLANGLSCVGRRVGTWSRLLRRFQFKHNLHVAIVALLIEPDAPPVVRPGNRGDSVIIGIRLLTVIGLDAGTHGVVKERSQHHRETRLSHDV
jgi:hypothetical protein